ncbi:MAG: hypothetical protein NC408_06720 [Candidatus Gastranaerophilales bacterium]|nr:hypothetical protein [Candidatus Gastranaerophilales bacterium]MCM1073019.1 hypothetical protein [Bacteroides sp.]
MKKYSKYLIASLCILAFLITLCFIPINASKLIPTIEKQVASELGVKIHIERLILRVGPLIKVKAPIMHVMYEDGQKFAQFDTVKFYIPWTSLIKKNPTIKTLEAKRLTVRVNSDDKYLNSLVEKLQAKDMSETPDFRLKNYNISYKNKESNNNYNLDGQALELNKVPNFKNFKINTVGNFSIDNKQYISYDLSITPKIDRPDEINLEGLTNFIDQIEELDFHSDIITDLKLYKNNETIQASGFINIDNISVLDANKKDPKSFVYLTLWGDKASILSNIYTSANKKVYIEGMVNNAKKPVLDLKVKTDEINLNDLYQKVKILADFSSLKGINSINGTLNANFTLKGDLNKIKSNGFMKVSNVNIKANGVKIENINSDIDFSNNSVNIVKAVGYVNNAPIMAKGSINKNIDIELLMNKVELNHLCPESFGVKKGIASLVANISGTLDNITHKENLQIDGLRIVNDKSDTTFDSIKIDTNKSNTAYINNILCKTKETEPIKIPSLKVFIERDSIRIPETNIFMPNSKLALKTEVTNYNSNDLSFNTSVNGYINSKDIKSLKTYSARYPFKVTINGNKSIQNILAQVLMENTAVLDEPAIINLSSKIDKNTLKIDDLSILSFNGVFSNDFKSNLKGQKKVIITGGIENLKDPVLKNIRVFFPQQLNIELADTHAQLKGDLFLNGKFNKPDIVGQLSLQHLFNQSMQLSLTNGIMDFNKNVVVINAPNVKVADTTMSVNATALTDFTNAITIKNANIKSKYLNTDTLLMYKDNPLLKLYPIVINDGKFYSERILANIYGSPLYISAFSGDIKLKDNVLTLKNISSELFNGKMEGSIDYDMRDEHFNSQIMARGVSAEPIFNIISTRKDSISGTMDFDTDLQGELTSKQSLNGNVKFIVQNGRMSTLGKLEHLLYAQNIVADNMLRTSLSVVTKAITLKDTGLFKYLRGDIQIEKGIANIKMLQSQGPLMALFIKGQYNPTNDFAKMVVLGRLSDEVITGLGAFGDFSMNKLMVMLTGEDPKFNIMPEDFEKIPQLPSKNTKEFRSIINGIIDKPSSVQSFNWVSYSQKSLKQKDVPMTNIKVPSFVDELPY